LGADSVGAFAAADVCGFMREGFGRVSFHLVAFVVVLATNWPRRVTVARS